MKPVHSSSSKLDRQKGAVLIEYALMLPLLVLVFLAIINLGLVVHEHQVLQNAAREGARFSALPRNQLGPSNPTGSLAEIQNRVVQYAALEHVTINPTEVTVNQSWLIAIGGGQVIYGSAVTIQHPRAFLLPGAGLLPYGGLTLTARAVFGNLYP